MRKLLNASALGLVIAGSAGAAQADDVNSRIAKLEQEIQLLKRQQEVKEEVAKAKSDKAATVELTKSGLAISSADKNFTLKAGGYAQIDGRAFFDDRESNTVNNQGLGTDQIIARRLRPVITGTAYKDWSFRLMPDFGQSTVRVFDAHIDYHLLDEVNFRFGKFKPPIGLERLQSATDNFFVERGDGANLVPNRDLGFQVYGDLIPETLEYQVGIFNGNADLDNTDADTDDNKDIAARIFATPFRKSDVLALQGLGVGVGGSYGKHEGTAATSGLTAGYKTPGQNNFFTYAAGTFADGNAWRVAPQGYYYFNNVGLLGEYTLSSQEVRNGTANKEITNHAWQVAGSYVLTGEDVNFKGSVKPARNFDPLHEGGWGAFELVARVGETDIDDDAFGIFASNQTSASRASSKGIGTNWYFNENVKLMVDFENTDFSDGAAGSGDRDTENVLLTRLQFRLN